MQQESVMADIICIECKTTVSDVSGFCPECGYPFDSALPEQETIIAAAEDEIAALQETIATISSPSPEVLLPILDSIRVELNELQRSVADLKRDSGANAATSAENSQKVLAEITMKLDALALFNSEKEAEAKATAVIATKKSLLAAFYKTLNSPNSMFEYMFYITVVQIVFVVVNLFLVAYIVTLVK
jgi:hypothetical protein